MRWSLSITRRNVATMVTSKRRWVVHRRLVLVHHRTTRRPAGAARVILACETFYFDDSPDKKSVRRVAGTIHCRSAPAVIRAFAFMLSSKLGVTRVLLLSFGDYGRGYVTSYNSGHRQLERN